MGELLQNPHLRGFPIASTLQWARRVYGEELIRRALLRLHPADRALFQGAIAGTAWYPISAWDRAVTALYAEIHRVTGEDDETLDWRNTCEGSGAIIRSLYKFFFRFMEPVSTLALINATFPRVYSHGRSEHVLNRVGYDHHRVVCPPEARQHMLRVLKHGKRHILEMIGAREVDYQLTRDEANPANPSEWIIESITRYQM